MENEQNNEMIDINTLRNLVNYIGFYLKNGININGVKKTFTILDYYSITNMDLKKAFAIIKNDKIERTYEESVYRGLFISFCIKENSNVLLTDIENVIKQHNAIIIDGERKELTSDEIISVFEYLNEHNIPLYSRIVYNAINRKITNFPILPFSTVEENDNEKSMKK